MPRLVLERHQQIDAEIGEQAGDERDPEQRFEPGARAQAEDHKTQPREEDERHEPILAIRGWTREVDVDRRGLYGGADRHAAFAARETPDDHLVRPEIDWRAGD